jgi:hypothetical protein
MAVDPLGVVYIAPVSMLPDGRMVDPARATFWASWQTGDRALEDVEIVGAEEAIAWGNERADVVYIRLGHTDGTYFSAGAAEENDLDEPPPPRWPPAGPPPEGWWDAKDES